MAHENTFSRAWVSAELSPRSSKASSFEDGESSDGGGEFPMQPRLSQPARTWESRRNTMNQAGKGKPQVSELLQRLENEISSLHPHRERQVVGVEDGSVRTPSWGTVDTLVECFSKKLADSGLLCFFLRWCCNSARSSKDKIGWSALSHAQ